MAELPLGPVMLDLAGKVLSHEERALLAHPLVGGVILFSRNYSSPQQLIELTADIRSVRRPQLLISVDHEGGRVQRFRDGFTLLPPMRSLGTMWTGSPERARELAQATGIVLAAELLVHGVDMSFTPVLDIDYGASSVIGDRAFSDDPRVIAELAGALVQGLAMAGMGSVGKHFPGHGYVQADSHVAVPVDGRAYDQIAAVDLIPYQHIKELSGVMPAHVVYPAVDEQPAGFSAKWLKDILRGRLGFDGLIFSDDLTMEGASTAGGIVARAEAAFSAGCDMVLVCNDPEAARELLAGLSPVSLHPGRAERLRGRTLARGAASLANNPTYQVARTRLDQGRLLFETLSLR